MEFNIGFVFILIEVIAIGVGINHTISALVFFLAGPKKQTNAYERVAG